MCSKTPFLLIPFPFFSMTSGKENTIKNKEIHDRGMKKVYFISNLGKNDFRFGFEKGNNVGGKANGEIS